MLERTAGLRIRGGRVRSAHVLEEASRPPGGRVRARGRGLFLRRVDAARRRRVPGAGVPQSAPGATASSLPAGDADTALTPKGGQSGEGASGAPSRDDDPARLVVIVVHLQEGADPEVTLASINEAVAGVFPGASVSVEREYRNVFQGYALRAPAGSLDAIRAVSGVKLAAIEGEMRVQ